MVVRSARARPRAAGLTAARRARGAIAGRFRPLDTGVDPYGAR